jgi:hypothetical protein
MSMSFGNTSTWSRPKSKKQVSTKWVDLSPRDHAPKAMNRVGKKSEWWMFINHVLELFFVRIELPRVCEIHSDFCDGYHIAKAHTRRRSVIRLGDYFHAFRVVWACQECHAWADQRERDGSEAIIEAIIQNRFRVMGLTEDRVRQLLLECAAEVIASDVERFGKYVVIL